MHAAARARLHREHRPAAALRDEVLLQVLPQRRASGEPAQLLRHSLSAVAQLAPQLAERGDALSRRSEPSSSTQRPICLGERREAGSIAAASSARSGALSAPRSSAARARRPPPTVSAIARARRGLSTPPAPAWAAASRTSGSRRAAARPLRRAARPPRPSAPAGGRPRPAAREGASAARELRPRGGRCDGAEPLRDRGELEHRERVRVHAPSVRP